MLHYKNKTFCPFKACNKFKKCEDALTEEVKLEAEKWWAEFHSKDKVPIIVYTDPPKCYNKYE